MKIVFTCYTCKNINKHADRPSKWTPNQEEFETFSDAVAHLISNFDNQAVSTHWMEAEIKE